MSEYQQALAAAEFIIEMRGDMEYPPPFEEAAIAVARMFLRNHALAHGEKPTE